MLNGHTLEEVQSFTYLANIIDQQGRTDEDIKARVTLRTSLTTKISLFITNVKSVLFYGVETWRMTKILGL